MLFARLVKVLSYNSPVLHDASCNPAMILLKMGSKSTWSNFVMACCI